MKTAKVNAYIMHIFGKIELLSIQLVHSHTQLLKIWLQIKDTKCCIIAYTQQ